jgi:hypothetical protein
MLANQQESAEEAVALADRNGSAKGLLDANGKVCEQLHKNNETRQTNGKCKNSEELEIDREQSRQDGQKHKGDGGVEMHGEGSDRRRKGDEELEAQLRLAIFASAAVAERVRPSDGGPSKDHTPTGQRREDSKGTNGVLARAADAQLPGWAAWAEVFCGNVASGRWLHADPLAGAAKAVDCVEKAGRAGPVVVYVVAFHSGAAKDVTRRYAGSFMRSLRARDEKWWTGVLGPFRQSMVCSW